MTESRSNRLDMKAKYPTVYAAWQMFARFDKNAKKLKVWIGFLRNIALFLAVCAPLLAILDLQFGDQTEVFKQMIIVLPILLSTFLTASNRLERGGKWFILRAAAERVKREIYSYRVGIGDYEDEAIKDENLAMHLEELYRRLMETKVNSIGLEPYDEVKLGLPPDIDYFADGDDGFSAISTGDYVHFRIESQIEFYVGRVNHFHRWMRGLNFLILLAGGVGTYLAAIGLELWIAVTTAVVTAFTSYMEYNQMEDTLTSYNQALANLESLKLWWEAQDEDKQETPAMCEDLVTKTEDVLNAELLRWIQAMESVLESEKGLGGGKEEGKPDNGPDSQEKGGKKTTGPITDGTFTGPTDGPHNAGMTGGEGFDEPRDLSPAELAEISGELEEKFSLDDEQAEEETED